jgi:hypothetical protein
MQKNCFYSSLMLRQNKLERSSLASWFIQEPAHILGHLKVLHLCKLKPYSQILELSERNEHR